MVSPGNTGKVDDALRRAIEAAGELKLNRAFAVWFRNRNNS